MDDSALGSLDADQAVEELPDLVGFEPVEQLAEGEAVCSGEVEQRTACEEGAEQLILNRGGWRPFHE